MAIAQTALTSGGSSTNASSYTTASISPTSNRTILLGIVTNGNQAVTSVTGNSLTWTEITSGAYGLAGRTSLFIGQGVPSVGAITINLAGTVNSCMWGVRSFSDVSYENPIIQVQTNYSGGKGPSKTVSMSAFEKSNNATLCWGAGESDSGVTLDAYTGGTELLDTGTYDAYMGEMNWNSGYQATTGVVRTPSGTNGYHGVIGVELNQGYSTNFLEMF